MYYYQELEKEWAIRKNVKPECMVVCSSGTAALHLAWEVFRAVEGLSEQTVRQKVVVPDYCMVACPRSVSLAGMQPEFVDVDADLLIPKFKGPAPSKRVLGALIVHTYGRKPTDIRSWRNYARWIVEDLAESHCVDPDPESDAACWSFYRNKIVHGEEGGAVWFRIPHHAAIARRLRNLGAEESPQSHVIPRGCNYRMSNTHARYILSSLNRMDVEVKMRWDTMMLFLQAIPNEFHMTPRLSPWVLDIRIPGMTLDLQHKLTKHAYYSIDAGREIPLFRSSFVPCSAQAEWKVEYADQLFPVSYQAYREVISIPLDRWHEYVLMMEPLRSAMYWIQRELNLLPKYDKEHVGIIHKKNQKAEPSSFRSSQ